MCNRCSGKSKQDVWNVVDGDEGAGKTTLSVCCAYYMAHKLGRKFTNDNILFNVDKLIEIGTKTEKNVLILDECVFGGLSGDAMTKIGKKLVKFAMISRKKNHVIFLNVPKFFKLNEYIMVDRSMALLHVYARGGVQLGRFVYFNKKKKEYLVTTYRKNRRRDYSKLYQIRGSFPDALKKIIDEKKYDEEKDKAILSLGEEEVSAKEQIREFKMHILKVLKELKIKLPNKHLEKLLLVTERTIQLYNLKNKGLRTRKPILI
jgi:energy-coupling factor transporter ATP-binding protein EcfA2